MVAEGKRFDFVFLSFSLLIWECVCAFSLLLTVPSGR